MFPQSLKEAMTDVPFCYDCKEEGLDEEGKPVFHGGCFCGEVGFCHASCVIKFAKMRASKEDDGNSDDIW